MTHLMKIFSGFFFQFAKKSIPLHFGSLGLFTPYINICVMKVGVEACYGL